MNDFFRGKGSSCRWLPQWKGAQWGNKLFKRHHVCILKFSNAIICIYHTLSLWVGSRVQAFIRQTQILNRCLTGSTAFKMGVQILKIHMTAAVMHALMRNLHRACEQWGEEAARTQNQTFTHIFFFNWSIILFKMTCVCVSNITVVSLNVCLDHFEIDERRVIMFPWQQVPPNILKYIIKCIFNHRLDL